MLGKASASSRIDFHCAVKMIIGDSDQCLSLEKNACDTSAIVLKRKFPDEVGDGSISSNRVYMSEPIQVPQISHNNVKNNYVTNQQPHQSTDQNGYSYQSRIDEIHQDGQQSYINLTVLAPPPLTPNHHHVVATSTGQSISHENNFSSQSLHTNIQNHQQQSSDHEIKMPTSIVSTPKVKNFQPGNSHVIRSCDKIA